MFFVNKSDNEDVIELIYSGIGFCIVIDQQETLKSESKLPYGRIIKHGKKELKKKYKKLKDNSKYILIDPIDEYRKQEVINTFETDKIGILEYTEDYIENQKLLDKAEEIQKQSEADRIRMLKELADDYCHNGIKKA